MCFSPITSFGAARTLSARLPGACSPRSVAWASFLACLMLPYLARIDHRSAWKIHWYGLMYLVGIGILAAGAFRPDLETRRNSPTWCSGWPWA